MPEREWGRNTEARSSQKTPKKTETERMLREINENNRNNTRRDARERERETSIEEWIVKRKRI